MFYNFKNDFQMNMRVYWISTSTSTKINIDPNKIRLIRKYSSWRQQLIKTFTVDCTYVMNDICRPSFAFLLPCQIYPGTHLWCVFSKQMQFIALPVQTVCVSSLCDLQTAGSLFWELLVSHPGKLHSEVGSGTKKVAYAVNETASTSVWSHFRNHCAVCS